MIKAPKKYIVSLVLFIWLGV